jgi:hypothetical protein
VSEQPLISIKLDTHGLAGELANAEPLVDAAALRAGEQAARVVQPSIAGETPVRTGFLKASERSFTAGPYRVMFEARASYASFVAYGTRRQHANPFIARGVRAVDAEIEAVYDNTFEAFARTFGDGS